MPRKNELPNKPRFNYAASRAYELLIELDICSFPIEPRDIIEHFNNWRLVGHHELKRKTIYDDPLNIKKEQAEAKTVKIRDNDEYLIVYDEQVNNESRIRWTLAHEIGHIVLGHLDHFEATALNRRGLSKKEYGVLEVEAHWFAAELLAPEPIMKRFRFGESSDGISLICDISKEAATRRLKQLKKVDHGSFVSDGKLLRNYYSHLINKGYLDSIFSTANRYHGSRLYPAMCKYCRVCKHCNAFIEEEGQVFCHICGNEVPAVHLYSPLKIDKGSFYIGYDFILKGKYYREIETKEDNRVVFCPICKNHEFSDGSQHCRICGTPLYNVCKNENKVIKGCCRYCPDCGGEAEFKELYDNLPESVSIDDFNNPDFDLDDYINYEYWDYIRMTIGNWEKNLDLFTALADSSAFHDGTEFIVLVKNKRELEIVNSCLDFILLCLQKYGYASIENVRCYSVL